MAVRGDNLVPTHERGPRTGFKKLNLMKAKAPEPAASSFDPSAAAAAAPYTKILTDPPPSPPDPQSHLAGGVAVLDGGLRV